MPESSTPAPPRRSRGKAPRAAGGAQSNAELHASASSGGAGLWNPPPAGQTRPGWAAEAVSLAGKRFWAAVGILTFFALALRLVGLSARSLWFDEIHTWNDAFWLPPENGAHWLFFRITDFATRILGRGEFGLRSYPVLCGTLGIFALTLWAGRIGGPLQGLLAGFTMAILAPHVAFSQEARYYAPMVLYSILMLFCTTEFFLARGWPRWLWALGAGAACWLARANHLTHLVMIGFLALWAAGCLILSPWGRRLLARWAIGSRPAPPARAIFFFVIIAGAIAAAAYKAAPIFTVYLKGATFARRTPNVEWSLAFFAHCLSVLGTGGRWNVFSEALGNWAFEILCLAGLIAWLRKRLSLGLLAIFGFFTTFLAIFAHPVTQPFDPKYIAFLYPLRIALFSAGFMALIDLAARRIAHISRPPAEGARARGFAALRPAMPWLIAGAAAALIAIPPLVRHYTSNKLAFRPAIRWLAENSRSGNPIFSYGHSNYGMYFYAQRFGIAWNRLHFLRWPSGKGETDAGQILNAIPPDGQLYFMHAWPHDIPPALDELLKKHFVAAARFPSGDGFNYDGMVYRWRWGAAVLREGRALQWSASAAQAPGEREISPDLIPISLPAPAQGQPCSFYAPYEIEAQWSVAPAPGKESQAHLLLDGKPLALTAGDGEKAAIASAKIVITPGLHEWKWEAPSEAAASQAAPSSAVPAIAVAPVQPLRMNVSGAQTSRRGRIGEWRDEEYQGRKTLKIIKNNWFEYSFHLEKGAVHRLGVTAFEETAGPSILEVEIDGRYAGLLAFKGRGAKWTEQSFPFQAESDGETQIRLRLISEAANSSGAAIPGAGAAISKISISRLNSVRSAASAQSSSKDGEWGADDRIDLSAMTSVVSEKELAFAGPDSPGRPAAAWTSQPNQFSATILENAPGAIGSSNSANEKKQGIVLRILPPYNGLLVSPPFKVQAGRYLCFQLPTETEEIYRIGATLVLILTDANGRAIRQVFPSEGSLNDDQDWDFVYRPLEGFARRDFTWLTMVPPGAEQAAIGLMAWPHPVPLRPPKMEVRLGSPVTLGGCPKLIMSNPPPAK